MTSRFRTTAAELVPTRREFVTDNDRGGNIKFTPDNLLINSGIISHDL